ncbi:uncharacterized protein IWZ02DRAFT_277161 [Phyllosticta citriasiana]|uniref:uncharacterized protein n=1 Tax=Phyllosticta citriasiana TaxID=595635 RepID=UPI0030FDD914
MRAWRCASETFHTAVLLLLLLLLPIIHGRFTVAVFVGWPGLAGRPSCGAQASWQPTTGENVARPFFTPNSMAWKTTDHRHVVVECEHTLSPFLGGLSTSGLFPFVPRSPPPSSLSVLSLEHVVLPPVSGATDAKSPHLAWLGLLFPLSRLLLFRFLHSSPLPVGTLTKGFLFVVPVFALLTSLRFSSKSRLLPSRRSDGVFAFSCSLAH